MSNTGESPRYESFSQPLDPTLLSIHLKDIDLDTHNTFGEHALKESGAWIDFLAHHDAAGGIIGVEDPFSYYLQRGPGRFYRAYQKDGPMIAGMIISPNSNDGFQVDGTYSVDDESATAAAYHKMLTRNFFDEFAGIPPLARTSNLTIAEDLVHGNPGLARAVYDLGLIRNGEIVVPMPGLAPFPFQDKSDEEKAYVREIIRDREITGILPHLDIEDENTDSVTEEFYRKGILVGTLVTKSVSKLDSFQRDKSVKAFTPNSTEVALRVPTLRSTELQVHFLKSIAENDIGLAKIILN